MFILDIIYTFLKLKYGTNDSMIYFVLLIRSNSALGTDFQIFEFLSQKEIGKKKKHSYAFKTSNIPFNMENDSVIQMWICMWSY